MSLISARLIDIAPVLVRIRMLPLHDVAVDDILGNGVTPKFVTYLSRLGNLDNKIVYFGATNHWK